MIQGYLPSTTLRETLERRGYVYREFTLANKPFGEFVAPNGWHWVVPSSYYDYPFISLTAQKIARDKKLSYAYAQSLGARIPETLQTTDITKAEAFLKQHGRIVVKPLAESGSRGLSLDVTSPEVLKRALGVATMHGHAPLLQRQFDGQELRLTVLNGRVFSVILRQSPRVIGNGVNTIRELIDQENEVRSKLIFPHISYPRLDDSNITNLSVEWSAIPSKGESIALSKTTMISQGASFYEVSNETHPSYIKLVETLAAQLSPGMLVVDLMVKDYQLAMTNESYVFLEFNTAPALKVYTSLRGGVMPDIFGKIADMIDEYSQLYVGTDKRGVID